jgi:integrase
MICYVFKPRRRVGGALRVAPRYSGKLRMDWEKDRPPEVIALHTTDKRVAERKLAELALEREKEHFGLIPPRVERESAGRPLNELLDAFLADVKAKGRAERTVEKYEQLRGLFCECGWEKLQNVTARTFTQWRQLGKLRPKTVNDYLRNASRFFHWLQHQGMVRENPLAHVERSDDREKQEYRRALTDEEVRRLLATAPRFRAIMYWLALETGIRRNEMDQLRVGDFMLETLQPIVRLPAAITKNGKTADLPLRSDLAAAIRSVLPDHALACEWVFRNRVPRVRVFKRDLVKAGIPFLDVAGRRLDFHALRKTLGTNLAVSGVSPRIAMELMRHSDIKLTMKVYTDASRLPLAAAVAGLPKFTLGDTQRHTQTVCVDGLSESSGVTDGQGGINLQSP